MKTILSALAVAAALGLAAAPAMAQQTVGANGEILDGMGAGGNIQNHYVFDGPPNADVSNLAITSGKLRASARLNRLDCDLYGAVNCDAVAAKHPAQSLIR
jgi:hypothetical protein